MCHLSGAGIARCSRFHDFRLENTEAADVYFTRLAKAPHVFGLSRSPLHALLQQSCHQSRPPLFS